MRRLLVFLRVERLLVRRDDLRLDDLRRDDLRLDDFRREDLRLRDLRREDLRREDLRLELLDDDLRLELLDDDLRTTCAPSGHTLLPLLRDTTLPFLATHDPARFVTLRDDDLRRDVFL